jgi:sulfide:quinone oxidoreductase
MSESDNLSATQDTPRRFEVLIAGGGVAGLEAAFALHALAPDRVHVTMLAPESEFIYRPNAVKEPFTLGYAHSYPLDALAADAGAELVQDALAQVDAERRLVHTAAGAELSYDALVLGLGVELGEGRPHVTTVDSRHIDECLHGLVQDVEEGYVKRVAFVVPAPVPWPLPAYELALLTAQRAWEMGMDLSVTILTPERAPLAVFGDQASGEVAELLAERGIDLITSAYCEFPQPKTITISGGSRELQFDRIVALPELRGPAVPGIPGDGGGFIPVDEFGAVRGVSGVYAAGDATDFPVKHGGLAAQQADAAARSIAALAGASITPQRFDPVLEGVLVTGAKPRYFAARLSRSGGADPEVFSASVDRSTPKIVARYLAAHLEQQTPNRLAPAARV